MGKPNGFTETELLTKFGKNAGYLGGGCYAVNFFNRELFDTCTHELFKKYKACFVKLDGRFYYK
jgi:hypothetical protein